jgi:hypothetical protein
LFVTPVVVAQSARADNGSMWTYAVDDYSESEVHHSVLGVRFKDGDIALTFKSAFEDAKAAGGIAGASPVKAAAAATAGNPVNMSYLSLMIDHGNNATTWTLHHSPWMSRCIHVCAYVCV